MKKKILLIEDEEIVSKVIKFNLERTGLAVVQASDGKQGLKKLEEEEFDAIVLDLILPEMDGFGFLNEMKKISHNLPIIVITNLAQESDQKKVQEMGVTAYFVKSNHKITDIVAYINNLLKD